VFDERPTTHDQRSLKPPPLQFGIKTLLGMMVAVGVVFGTLRWIGASEQTSYLVMGILVVSLLAAVGLIVAIANIGGDDE
jgi:magnesium-transporting ATPase (P-type)